MLIEQRPIGGIAVVSKTKSPPPEPTLEEFFKEHGIEGKVATAAAIKRLRELWDEGKASGPPNRWILTN
jgi:hypothetical protein